MGRVGCERVRPLQGSESPKSGKRRGAQRILFSSKKNTTESNFGTGSAIRCGDKKTLRRLPRNACFPKEKKQKKTVRTIKNYGHSKILRISSAVVFVVRMGPSGVRGKEKLQCLKQRSSTIRKKDLNYK